MKCLNNKITVTGDMRKFLEYVLVPQHRSGKDKIFINLLGYRPYNLTDATELLALYLEQAKIKFAQGIGGMKPTNMGNASRWKLKCVDEFS